LYSAFVRAVLLTRHPIHLSAKILRPVTSGVSESALDLQPIDTHVRELAFAMEVADESVVMIAT
jgi:hypothetical protein